MSLEKIKTTTKELISSLQKKPYHVRVRILWGTVLVLGSILLVVWVANLKSTINKMDSSNMLGIDVSQIAKQIEESQLKHISIEWLEQDDNLLKVYFKISNSTNDILNFSKPEDIKLDIGSAIQQPTKITDRQDKPFVQRILSKTQNFGVLTFVVPSADGATLFFDQLSFEQQPDKIFKETFVLNYEELNKKPGIRD